jgi:hypothetical protein
VVVEGRLAWLRVRVEQAPLTALGKGHADSRGKAGAERTCRDLDTGGVVDLGVAGGE